MQTDVLFGIKVDTEDYGNELWRREAGQPLEYWSYLLALKEAAETVGKWPDVDQKPSDEEEARQMRVLSAQVVAVIPVRLLATWVVAGKLNKEAMDQLASIMTSFDPVELMHDVAKGEEK